MSVADAYDAMINDRPYREVLTENEVLLELREFRGSQFDPVIVNIFMQLHNQD